MWVITGGRWDVTGLKSRPDGGGLATRDLHSRQGASREGGGQPTEAVRDALQHLKVVEAAGKKSKTVARLRRAETIPRSKVRTSLLVEPNADGANGDVLPRRTVPVDMDVRAAWCVDE